MRIIQRIITGNIINNTPRVCWTINVVLLVSDNNADFWSWNDSTTKRSSLPSFGFPSSYILADGPILHPLSPSTYQTKSNLRPSAGLSEHVGEKTHCFEGHVQICFTIPKIPWFDALLGSSDAMNFSIFYMAIWASKILDQASGTAGPLEFHTSREQRVLERSVKVPAQ